MSYTPMVFYLPPRWVLPPLPPPLRVCGPRPRWDSSGWSSMGSLWGSSRRPPCGERLRGCTGLLEDRRELELLLALRALVSELPLVPPAAPSASPSGGGGRGRVCSLVYRQ